MADHANSWGFHQPHGHTSIKIICADVRDTLSLSPWPDSMDYALFPRLDAFEDAQLSICAIHWHGLLAAGLTCFIFWWFVSFFFSFSVTLIFQLCRWERKQNMPLWHINERDDTVTRSLRLTWAVLVQTCRWVKNILTRWAVALTATSPFSPA